MSDVWQWCSFADPKRPAGSQFLGVAIVRGDDVVAAAIEAHRLRCNPGGEVLAYPIPAGMLEAIPESERNRLLTRDECVALERAWKARQG